MNTCKAIFFGLALIALAIFARDIVKPADAGIMDGGRYMGLRYSDTKLIWIVDTETGVAKIRSLVTAGPFVKSCGGWIK